MMDDPSTSRIKTEADDDDEEFAGGFHIFNQINMESLEDTKPEITVKTEILDDSYPTEHTSLVKCEHLHIADDHDISGVTIKTESHELETNNNNICPVHKTEPGVGIKTECEEMCSFAGADDIIDVHLSTSSSSEDESGSEESTSSSGTDREGNSRTRTEDDKGRTQVTGATDSLECQICHKVFARKRYLRRHMKTHWRVDKSQPKPFECKICGRAQVHASDFKRHMQSHTGEKPHKCPICQKSFSRASQVTRHLRAHAGEKKHPVSKSIRENTVQCTICEKKYLNKSELSRHLRTHLEPREKPHKCPVCDLHFSQAAHVKTHVMLHTGEKPFQCDTCGKYFRQRKHLRSHLAVHLDDADKPYSCTLCGLRFGTASGLTQHDKSKRHLRKLKLSGPCLE